jgi:hypothetical protein
VRDTISPSGSSAIEANQQNIDTQSSPPRRAYRPIFLVRSIDNPHLRTQGAMISSPNAFRMPTI